MELRNLITFVTIAETGNMTQAAMRCNITQGAASQQIKAFEKELKTKLFDRKGKELVLTEGGKIFLKYARTIMKEIQQGKDEIESMKGPLHGELKIGVGSFIAPYIRRAAVEFMERYPNVLLLVHFDQAKILNNMLRNDDLDLAFTLNTAYHNEGIVSKPCIPFHLSAIMSRKHELATKEMVTYEDLLKCKVVMPDVGERVFQTFQRYTDKDLSKLPVSLIISEPSEALMVIDQLNAVTFLPRDYTITSQKLISKPIETLDMELMSNAHWMKHRPMRASAKAFLEIIKEIQTM